MACGMTSLARSFVVSTSWVSQVDTLKKRGNTLEDEEQSHYPGCTIQCFFAPDTDVDRS